MWLSRITMHICYLCGLWTKEPAAESVPYAITQSVHYPGNWGMNCIAGVLVLFNCEIVPTETLQSKDFLHNHRHLTVCILRKLKKKITHIQRRSEMSYTPVWDDSSSLSSSFLPFFLVFLILYSLALLPPPPLTLPLPSGGKMTLVSIT